MGQTLTNGVYLPDNGERNCYTGLSQNWQKLDNLLGNKGDKVSFSQTLTEGVEIGKITINGVDIAMYHTDYSDKADADNVYTKAEVDASLSAKADKATTLSGYGITDAYTKVQVENKISELVNSAPETLDTLNELASALGNDPNFATTVANQIGTKANDSDVVHRSGDESISGVKNFSSDTIMKSINRGASTSSLSIFGGTTNTDGSSLYMYGADQQTGKGRFILRARNNESSNNDLVGTPDGSLTWCNQNVDTIDSQGDGWIRYTNGLQICWGEGVNSSGTATVSYPASFSGANPKVMLTRIGTKADILSYNVSSSTTSVGKFNFYNINGTVLTTSASCHYLAIGLWK